MPVDEENFHKSWLLLITIGVIICVIFSPTIKIPKRDFSFQIDLGLAPIIGVILLLCSTTISFSTLLVGILGHADTIIPWQIIIIFFSLGYICISWDLTGIFEYISLKTLAKAGSSGRKIFLALFFLSSTLTLASSNDIVILTLTPIVAVFTEATGADPTPFLFAQFFAANIWSISLIIGNPTNVIVAEGFDIEFIDYSFWMVPTAISSGFTCLICLVIYFFREIPKQLNVPQREIPKLKDKLGAIFGALLMGTCIVLLCLGKWIDLSIWFTCSVCFGVMFIWDLTRDILYCCVNRVNPFKYCFRKKETPVSQKRMSSPTEEDPLLTNKPHLSKFEEGNLDSSELEGPRIFLVIKRLPWKILPFVVCMFIIVEGFNQTGWSDIFARLLIKLYINPTVAIFSTAVITSLAANVLNNQPMTILFTTILQDKIFDDLPVPTRQGALFGLVLGSNFGANLTLVGALAGIMWSKILQNKGIKAITFLQFMKVGFIITPWVILVASSSLSLQTYIYYTYFK